MWRMGCAVYSVCIERGIAFWSSCTNHHVSLSLAIAPPIIPDDDGVADENRRLLAGAASKDAHKYNESAVQLTLASHFHSLMPYEDVVVKTEGLEADDLLGGFGRERRVVCAFAV
uniref:Uncharacterized protein n=1 Tax=Psilocybe cubensis TaxID=181762 RepID=A0A8H7XMT5_PSICU